MARIPARGVTIVTPFHNGVNPRVLSQEDLRDVLVDLCPQTVFANSDLEVFYSKLQSMLGLWIADTNRLDVATLAKTFTTTGKELNKIANILRGHETGLHEIHDTEIVSQLRDILALDPEVGSRQQADDLIALFRGSAAKVAHACLVAAHDLKLTVGESGRPPAEWHDQFTALLLAIAERAGLNRA